jgi:uncharacterized membrane protein
MSRRALAVFAVILIGYAALSHYSNSRPDAKALAVGLSIGPILLIGLALLLRWTTVPITLGVACMVGAVVYYCLPALEKNYEWLDLVQQAGVYGLVMVSFARSLWPGKTPLCTQLAIQMHGTLDASEIAYTRRATAAWAVFYLALTITIVVLFFVAPLKVWSMFVNFATFGLIVAMALGDHLLRRAVLPPRPSRGLIDVLQRALLG